MAENEVMTKLRDFLDKCQERPRMSPVLYIDDTFAVLDPL